MRRPPFLTAPALVLLAGCVAVSPRDAPPAAQPDASPRLVQAIDRDWTFTYDPAPEPDLALAQPGHDDGAWPAVALPHTWSTYETTGAVHPFIRSASERDDPYWWTGWGWYRKRLVVPDSLRGRRLSVEFGAAQKVARVYLDGVLVGEHVGGYVGFSVDLTDHVRFGEENVLAVAVHNRRDDRLRTPPMTAGNFNVYGGLYRGVRLVAMDPLYVPFQGSADHEGGLRWRTPAVDSSRAELTVTTFVANATGRPARVAVRTTVLDPDGAVVDVEERQRDLAPGQTAGVDVPFAPVERPHLWSPETPHVYRLRSEVFALGPDERRLVDVHDAPLGFRWFRWDHDQDALVLNGRRVRINGTNRHQEFPWLGDAIPDWVTRHDMDDMHRGLGHNFLRPAHYPNDPLLYSLADSLGIILVDEVPMIKNLDFSAQTQERMVREMVRRNRNHPSVLFWSAGNETDRAADSRWVVEEDTSRIVHIRKASNYGDFVTHTHEDLDLEQLLRVTVPGWIDADDVPAGVDPRPENGQVAGTEWWQHQTARVPGASVRGDLREDVSVWLYADHGADREYRQNPLLHVNPKGWVDMYRQPKMIYGLWQANMLDSLVVWVQAPRWRAAYAGERVDVTVDSNGDAVELVADGRSLGVQRPTAEGFRSVTFEDVEVRGTVVAVATRGAETARDSVRLAGPPVRLVAESSHPSIPAGRGGVAVVRVWAEDATGARVPDVAPPLAWSVSGPASLVSPPTYVRDESVGAMEGVFYAALPTAAVVRSGAEAGRAVVRVETPGLGPAEVEVAVLEPRPAPGAFVGEPRLSGAGRQRVARLDVAGRTAQLPEVAALGPAQRPLRLADTTAAGRLGAARAYLAADFEADTTTAAYDALADALAATLGRTGGELVEDDVDLLGRRYADALRLGAYLRLLPVDGQWRTTRARAYAQAIVVGGAAVDLEAERERLAVLDRTDTRFVSAAPWAESAYDNAAGWTVVPTDDLARAVGLVTPDFADLPADVQARVLAAVAALTPTVTRAGDGYRMTPGQPVAVPVLDALLRSP